MITIAGVGGIPEEGIPRHTARRDRGSSMLEPKDAVELSGKAREAAQILQVAAETDVEQLRQERIEQARQRIAEGSYQIVEIVKLVASRISRFSA